MKKLGYVIAWTIGILLLILFSPLIILGFIMYFIFIVIPSPIERMIYYKSKYYNDYERKYYMGITYDVRYKLYEKLKGYKEDLVFHNVDNNKILVIESNNKIFVINGIESEFYYDVDKQQWTVVYDLADYEESVNEDVSRDSREVVVEYVLEDFMKKILDDLSIIYDGKDIICVISKSVIEYDYKYVKDDDGLLVYKGYKGLVNKMKGLF